MTRVRTVCPLDCWDACGMVAEVVDGQVVKLDGDPDHPISRGTLCARTYRYPERAFSDERIVYPMRRRGSEFARVSWDEALDEIVGRLETLRAAGRTQAVFHFQSSGSMGVLKRLSARFWNLLGGVTVAEGDFCLGAGKTALEQQLGDYRPHAFDDVRNSRAIFLWGRDPLISGPHRMAFLKEARDRGAVVISINPLAIARSPVVSESVRLRPGTDAWLAAAMAKVLIEKGRIDARFVRDRTEGYEQFAGLVRDLSLDEAARITGVARADICRLALLYADADPAAILFGTGSIRYRNGLENARWVTALPALVGSYGRAGGGLSYSIRHMRDTDTERWEAPLGANHRPLGATDWPRHLSALDPAIEVLWVNGANPAAMLPDNDAMARALARIPFKVVVDLHWTDTARQADLVLPHPSFLEEEGVVTSWGHALVAWQNRAVAPQGEARSDLEIFQALAQRMGFGDEMTGTAEEWSRRLMGSVLGEEEWRAMCHERGHARSRAHEDVPYADTAFPREGGRYLFPAGLPSESDLPQPSREFPFLLLTPKNRERHLSQTIPSREPERLTGTMAADVARAAGRSSGRFTLASRLGAIEVELSVDETLLDGLVVVPMGGARHGRTSPNLLITADTARDGVTAAYYDCPVRVTAV
ncbi:MAG: molybdopterin-dependent oxidoreductase [Candidatus Eisenbacteria bacterium]|nr:molybdopterin-dependent oxidoreductase [Candidatus Eisenbacteria bacterium]